jgi:hypothetical protein
VVQAHGMVLEGGVAVGHGRMARVPGFSEETEIREAKAAHEGRTGLALLPGPAFLSFGVKEHAQVQRRLNADQGQAEG